jgi:hypothetical protein
MIRQIQLNIGLTPVIDQDRQTGDFVVYYNEFPQAIASGSTADEAETNLGYLVEDMWRKQSADLKRYLLENYSQSIHINSPTNC